MADVVFVKCYHTECIFHSGKTNECKKPTLVLKRSKDSNMRICKSLKLRY